MAVLKSARPCEALRPYVRAYAYRRFSTEDLVVVEAVPAQLEQVLNFEIGLLPGVWHRLGEISSHAWIGGAQTEFPGHLKLFPGVESFAIFFHPTGWSQLFHVPMAEVTNRLYDGPSVLGRVLEELWNRLGEERTFEARVVLAENFLQNLLSGVSSKTAVISAAADIFIGHGARSIRNISTSHSLSIRQFERLFRIETGTSPKVFARVARFQASVDAKIANPQKSWLDIAHMFGYYDQMHMIHDYKKLGHGTPASLLAEMGDTRPIGLASDTNCI